MSSDRASRNASDGEGGGETETFAGRAAPSPAWSPIAGERETYYGRDKCIVWTQPWDLSRKEGVQKETISTFYPHSVFFNENWLVL